MSEQFLTAQQQLTTLTNRLQMNKAAF